MLSWSVVSTSDRRNQRLVEGTPLHRPYCPPGGGAGGHALGRMMLSPTGAQATGSTAAKAVSAVAAMWRRGRGRAGGVAPASRDRVVSAAPSIPAASGDSWSAMPFSSARVAPKLSLSPGADAPGLVRANIWQSSRSSRGLPEIASGQTEPVDFRAEPQRRRDVDSAGWLAQPTIRVVGRGFGCACREVAVVCPGRPPCARTALAPIMWWWLALCRARACPQPCRFCRALI